MEENLDLIEEACGTKPIYQDLIQVTNDPNFVFINDPNFPALRLFDIDGNVINVNSWIECANYVNGGWTSTYYSGMKSELIFLVLVISYSFGYFISKKRSLIKNNVK